MHSKVWLATPVLLAHVEVTANIILLTGPKLRYPHGTCDRNTRKLARTNSQAHTQMITRTAAAAPYLSIMQERLISAEQRIHYNAK